MSGTSEHQRQSGHTGSPHIDTQSLSDQGTHLYETIATLEYSGQRPTLAAIALAVGRSEDELGPLLDSLAAGGLLTRSDAADGPLYEPARRDWSARPDQAAGHSLP